jgi:hypothetical protein
MQQFIGACNGKPGIAIGAAALCSVGMLERAHSQQPVGLYQYDKSDPLFR